MPKQPDYFGRYQVLEELGSGGMGVVYLCVDPRLARPVAIKVLKPLEHATPEERERYRARFRQEAEAAGRLSHPDIVQIFDVGPSYIVMEFIEGETLQALLRRGAALPVRKIVTLLLRAADAIDCAHRAGIVHRDIKPANVMLTGDDGLKVMDFGVARLDTSNLTVAGSVVGSVRYMAPEQMMGDRVDGRADVFSLAAVAYELLTATVPFPGKTITEVVSRVVHGSHLPPRQADPRLPAAVDEVFARAFAPRPGERCARASDFAKELQQALQPVLDLEVFHRGESGSPTQVQALARTITEAVKDERPTVPMPAIGPAARAPHATGREGVLMLDSDPPGAGVSVDGVASGTTPLAELDLLFGRHLLRLEAPGRETVTAEVELTRQHPLLAATFTLPPAGGSGGAVRPGQWVPFGPDVIPPRRIAGSLPAYPDAARERGIEGSPVVEVWVGETGEVVDVALRESAGAALDGALLEAVAGWRFTPPTCRGVPVSLRLTVQHRFQR